MQLRWSSHTQLRAGKAKKKIKNLTVVESVSRCVKPPLTSKADPPSEKQMCDSNPESEPPT